MSKVRIAQISCDWRDHITGNQIMEAIESVIDEVDAGCKGGFISNCPQSDVDSIVMFVSNVKLTNSQIGELWYAGDLGTQDEDFWEGNNIDDITAQLRKHIDELE